MCRPSEAYSAENMRDMFRTELSLPQTVGDRITVKLPLTPGVYRVRIFFAELYRRYRFEGERLLDVEVNNVVRS